MGGFIQSVWDVLVLVVLFGATIFVHELGHFLLARKLGMVVDVFSLGFGPAIWKKEHKGVVYKISIIPLGGYVALPQLDPSAMSGVQGKEKGNETEPQGEEEQRILPPVSPWAKILVSLAGSAGNVLFAVLLAWVIYANPQAVTGAEPTDIGQVATNSVAYREGIRPGDRVLAVNGEEVDSWYRLAEEALLGAGDDGKIVLTVRSDGEERRVSVNVSTNQLSGQPIPGLSRARKCAVTNVSQTAANGLREGDIVISLNGKEVVSCQHLRHLSRGMEGEEATLTVRRGDAEVEVTAMLPIEGTSPYNRCMVGGVLDGSPADEAGLRAGDVIRTFDGVPVVNWRQFTASVDKHAGREVPISVWRNGKLVETEVTPEYDEDRGRALIGIALGVRPSLPWMRYRNPGAQIGHDASAIFRVLSALVNPEESRRAAGAIGGPLMILMTLWTSIKISMLNAVGFLRFLNVNLAILNLLPIPVLDGGHIIFSLWEGITRRRVNPKLVNILVNIFMVILLLLMLLITIRDIDRAFTGRAKQGGAKASETNKYSDAGAEPATIPTDSE